MTRPPIPSPAAERPARRWIAGAALGLAAACGPAEPAPVGLPDVVLQHVVRDVVADWDSVRVLEQSDEVALDVGPAVFEVRHALAAAPQVVRAFPDSAFEFDLVDVGAGQHLVAETFVYAPDPGHRDPVTGTFRILVDGQLAAELEADYPYAEDAPEHPFERVLGELSVDLSPFAGRDVTVRMETVRGPPSGGGLLPDAMLWWSVEVRAPVAVPRETVGAGRPHLLVLCVDTLAAGRTSLVDPALGTTPHLAALARRGVVFTQAQSPASWTLPATASMLTGLPPNTHGVIGDSRSYLMDELTTWPELLRREGLEGAAFVANTLVAEGNNFQQGFGTWRQLDEQDAELLNESLLEWVDAQPAGARWFAYVHYMDPHAPYEPPPEERARYAGDYVERRDFGGHLPGRLQRGEIEPLAPDEQAHVADLYEAEVAAFDAALGRLLDALQARGLVEDTVIVLTADHGEELFEHGRLGHGYALNQPMLHVPLVIAGPGLPRGVVRDQPVSTAGLFATLLALGGVEAQPAGVAPELLAADEDDVFSGTITRLFGPERTLVALRRGDLKVVCTLAVAEDGTESAAGFEAFDLASPGGEHLPLDPATAPREVAQQIDAMVADALEWHRRTAEARPPGEQPLNPAMRRALEQVGYLGGDDDDR